MPEYVHYPETYGAIGDGVASDRAAILTAAAKAVATGGVLQLTAPKYFTGGGALELPAGLHMRGRSLLEGGMYGATAVNVRGNTIIEGVSVRNAATGYRFALSVAPGSDDIQLIGCRFPDGGGSVGVYCNNPGISNVTLDRCVFDGQSYGFLSNSGMGGVPESGAHDIRNVTVTRSVFTNITAEGIEFNHPYGVGANGVRGTAHNFTVSKNTISVRGGTGRTAGFAIGVAGATDVKITENTITEARYEGIHVEDDARDVIISGNHVANIVGDDAYAGISILPSCMNVKITDNTVRNVTGHRAAGGIVLGYDSRPKDSQHVTIRGNHVEGTSRDGIVVLADNGGNFRITGNTVVDVARDGVLIGGHMDHGFHVTDNTITGAGGYGVRVATLGAMNKPHTIRDNTIKRAALGETSIPPKV